MVVSDDLPKCEANYAALTPISFLKRTASVYPDRKSVIYGDRVFTWSQTFDRCRQLASALRSFISAGDTVAVIAPNVPAMYELHFGVPMANAVLNTLNTRLDVRMLARILGHSEAKVFFVDTEFLEMAEQAVQQLSKKPLIVHIEDKAFQARAGRPVHPEYEDLLRRGDSKFPICWPADEWEAISINYTSGTTAHPKGVVYHHRGAYINALVSALDWQMPQGPVFLWTLPMFHCNGWLFPWTIAAQSGTNVCLRAVTPKAVFDAIAQHRVTHLCGAPVVLNMIYSAHEREKKPLPHAVHILTGGAPPPASVLLRIESLGFSVDHGYGLTESYGPATSCIWKPEWDSLPSEERASLKARQGVGHVGLVDVDVLDPHTMTPVPRDGQTMGEVMMKGNCLMKGYLKEPQLTEEAFRGGWFHTGDLGVMHPDNYIALKDRSKDIIISGGENISSIEVESVLFRHPHVLEAAVVARPDEFWGETPCAYVTLNDPSFVDRVTEKDIIEFCRNNLPKYMIPKTVVFRDLPKTVTGKVQKNVLREHAKKLGSLRPPTSKL
ncbi:3-(methylthio)propionyl---CoA ligase [Marchantia polymorpha subsp. ruderalis]|uniref:AMP-dependent synthetase/ligase domain-containing protein n=4 Tax=Marchantia polymorpha TaxID=3197 RepID=A0A176VFR8_MARPO|nr:hypothetical protein AXG93_1040s1010 [Marchantia polymorpha subsp. ruderalis]PTQ45616.1 hypothetical protein MARPO_0014s0135 [Marchantia polymorpha]BBM98108.1 hypothetical protein Mp_1g10910 [Marchantia polymorpha subsp. ruderalis]|eukprot:PTQ45616.1 hypothetical protein MARPO_0014s0135 [Marchantia polymorpha]